MTIQHIAAVLNLPRTTFGSTGERFVMVALANHTDEEGLCWPSVRRLADEVGQSDGMVRRHLERLCAASWIAKLHRRRRNDGTLSVWVYRLDVGRLGLPVDSQRAPVRGSGPPSAHGRRNQRAPARAQEPSSNPHRVTGRSTGSPARGTGSAETRSTFLMGSGVIGDTAELSPTALAALEALDAADAES